MGMGKNKPIRHLGMAMTEEEHRRWHQEHEGKGLTAEEHQKLMEHLGVSPEEECQWHPAHPAGEDGAAAGPGPDDTPVNCFALGGGFLEYCVKQGWLTRQRQGRATKYYVTGASRRALAEYGIVKY
jgi:hypothetical protein